MAEQKTTYILITQCLQNGFFLDAESRLALPAEEALRLLVGSPDEFEPELEDFEDVNRLAALFKLNEEAEKDLFLKFVNEKRPNQNHAEAVPPEGENGSEPPSKPQEVESLRQLLRDPTQFYADFVAYRAEREKNNDNRRNIPPDLLQSGPLYQFLQAVTEVEGPKRNNPLHMIHIRDWHQLSNEFDDERRHYGLHCEAGTWSAEPLAGFEQFLCPWAGDPKAEKAAQSVKGFEQNGVRYYDIRSNSVFDFYPEHGAPSLLEKILANIITGDPDQRVVLVMIGVYTDIKVKILLTNLRSRYSINNLIVSGVLTAAPSLERHLAALDFAAKVLTVEVVHSLNDLVQLLNPQRKDAQIPKTIWQNSVNFRQYSTYFLDKQNLLAYQEKKQLEYIELTKRRAARVYRVIFNTSRVLMYLGLAFMAIAALAALFAVISPGRATSPYLIGTGLLGAAGLAQLMLIVYSNPIQQLQKNLNNLVRLQTNLETQSLVLALTRYHLSRPERLYPKDPQREEAELKNLHEQIRIITEASEITSQQFADVDEALGELAAEAGESFPGSGLSPNG